MTDITELQTELARLDPVTDGAGTTASICSDGCVAVHWVDGGADVDESTAFDPDDAEILTAILRLLPDGCPTAEGEDGSLWEVIITAHSEGVASARRYAVEHHSDPMMDEEG